MSAARRAAAALLAIALLAAVACADGGAISAVVPSRAGPEAMREGNQAFSAGSDAYQERDYDRAALQFKDAVAAYDRAAEAMPESVEPLFNSGNALYMQNRMFEAIDKYEEALKGADAQLASNIYANLCRAVLESGDPQGAVESCNSAIEIDPNNDVAKRALEEALEEQERRDRREEQGEIPGQGEDEQPDPTADQPQPPQPGQQQPAPTDQPGQQQPAPTDQQDQQGEQSPGDQQPTDAEPGDQPSSADQQPLAEVPPTGLTEEQARQLLESVGDRTRALPRTGWSDGTSRGSPPERDW